MPLDQEELRLIQKSRMIHERIVDALIKEGIPTDAKKVDMVIKTLRSLDTNVVSVNKLKIDESAATNDASFKDMLVKLMLDRDLKPNKNIPDKSVSIPDSVTRENPVEGETVIGIDKMTYNEFMEKAG